MKIVHKNLKDGIVKVDVQNVDDLWYLSVLLEPGDLVSGESERKIKLGESDEKSRVIRKRVFLTIATEKIEFADSTLRVLGTVTEGTDDVPAGAYHTLEIEPYKAYTIQKKEWLGYQLEKLEEAAKQRSLKILVVVFDREEAIFGMLKTQGYEILSHIKGDVKKKALDEKKQDNFYKEIADHIAEYVKRHSVEHVIAASPAFWRDYVQKELRADLMKKVTFATCSAVDASTINELTHRPELKHVLEEDRRSKEDSLVEELLAGLAKDKVCYGMKDVKKRVEEGAIKSVLVAEEFLKKCRANKSFKDVEDVMKAVDKAKGTVSIISTDDASKKLMGIGGIAGFLRW